MEINMADSMFSKESAKRQKEQNEKLAANGLAADQDEKKINVNFSIKPSAKAKMQAKAKELGISASSLLQLWINEKCE